MCVGALRSGEIVIIIVRICDWNTSWR